MAKVEFAFPVEKIHGKISKKHKIGFAYRKISEKKYTTGYGERKTSITANEVAIRQKFTAVQAATRARLIDPEYIHVDQLAFKEQTYYKTLWGYVFKQCWDSYEG